MDGLPLMPKEGAKAVSRAGFAREDSQDLFDGKRRRAIKHLH
jgi:hypothetical protein